MLRRGDFDLNSVQRYTDSLKEALRQTMLSQELVFRRQVHELHQLYRTQKSLMEDLSWKEFNDYNAWTATTLLTPKSHETSAKYNRLAEERTFSSMPLDFSEESLGTYYTHQHSLRDFKQRPIDFRLPPEHCIGHVGSDFPNKRGVCDTPKESGEIKSPFSGDNVSDVREVKLSLSIGQGARKKEPAITWSNNTYSCSQEVIDLEEPFGRVSNESAKPVPHQGFAAIAVYPSCKHDSKVPILSDLLLKSEKDPVQVITLLDGSRSCQEQSSSNPGAMECHDDLQHENLVAEKQQFTSSRRRHIDLNIAEIDYSSCYSNDPQVAHPSTASSLGAPCGLVGEYQKEGFSSPDLVSSDGKDNSKVNMVINANYCEAVMGCIDFESVSGPPLESSEDQNRSSDLQVDLNHADGITLVNAEGSRGQKDVESSFPHPSQDTVHAASCSFVGDNHSSNVKTTQSRIQLGESNISASNEVSEIQLSSEVVETAPGDPDLRSSHSSELEHGCYSKKEEPLEVDVLIKTAAESLVHLSWESSTCYPDCASNSGSKGMNDDKKEQPDYSFDSYELIALKLTETSIDDYSVTSKPVELNDEMEKKDFSCKLKRGRRLKDFQRDILPSLASLSRHEILEDINIMEGVIRSREYRKIRGKMGDGPSCSIPARGRRLRRNYTRRRNYL